LSDKLAVLDDAKILAHQRLSFSGHRHDPALALVPRAWSLEGEAGAVDS
jgi:hypothetical protein